MRKTMYRFSNTTGRDVPRQTRSAASGPTPILKTVHCIAVDPGSPSGSMSACWFPTAAEADGAFLKMSNSEAMESRTLERFKLSVPASATREKIDELALTAVQWDAYLPIVRRAGDRRAANDSAPAPLGSYELGWPYDADPEVGIRPRG
ncbi:hypothetical protein LJR290_007712 [Variovorax sp. LjRoot290]|uniref:hypothetical protein n=1 Tax=unclassified Variovorax TaxID=663243 RepID=UPI003ED09813